MHDDILALQNQLDNSQSNLESTLARLNETNLRGFAEMGSSTGNENNGSSFDGNITVDFNDSRIVEANNNTTIAINDLKNMDRDKVDDILSYIDELNSTLTDFTSLIDDLKTSTDNIKSSFTNVYHPTFPHPNSCVYNFKVLNQDVPIDLCEKVSPLKPYIIFVLSIYFLKLLVDLHLYFISKIMIKYG